jgi:hypothetical protein
MPVPGRKDFIKGICKGALLSRFVMCHLKFIHDWSWMGWAGFLGRRDPFLHNQKLLPEHVPVHPLPQRLPIDASGSAPSAGGD